MITKGSRFFLGFSALAYLGAIVYGLSTGGHLFGVFTLGYKEAVGELLGYSLLIGVSAVSLGLGCICLALRDADPAAEAQVAHLDHAPAVDAPNTPSVWPVVAAFGLGMAAVGLVVSSALFAAGMVAIAIVVVEWAIKAWSERQTGDPEVNQAIRNRLMHPIEIPVGALLAIGLIVACISRVLLAAPEAGSTVIAIVVATLILLTASLIATRPKASANIVSGLLLAVGIGVIAAGIAAASLGPRDFEEHHVDEGYQQPRVGGELPPERPSTTTTVAGATATTVAPAETTTTTAPADTPATTTVDGPVTTTSIAGGSN